jgi:hypothetical protein
MLHLWAFEGRYDPNMGLTRVHVGFTPKQLKVLDKLAEKLLLDRNSVIRLALARLAESEKIK